MGTGYLLDTNVVIDFSSQKLPEKSNLLITEIIDTLPQLSVINKIELLSFINVTPQISTFIEEAIIIHINDDIVLKTIEIRKKYKIKLPDAIIAATALVFDLILITHNITDFKSISGLKLMDSFLAG